MTYSSRVLHRPLISLIFLLLMLFFNQAHASVADKEIRIGVLSFRSIEQTQRQWQPTADYLNIAIPGYHFSIVALFFPDLDEAVRQKQLEFVLTNPEHYAMLRTNHGLAALATLMPMAGGHPVSSFGGTIFTRADRKDINRLQDLRGKVMASVGEQSFGSYLIARWTLLKQGIQISEIGKMHFTGMPQDKVVQEVLTGKSDAGFVRTGVLEGMVDDGKLQLDQIKVLNHQPKESFPQLLSTDLYPEWPFSAMRNVPDDLIKSITLALFNINQEDPAARSGKYFGFTPPGDYSPVEAVMLRLRVHPGQDNDFDWRDIYQKYFTSIMIGLAALLLGMLGTAIHLWRTNRILKHTNFQRDKLASELQIANASLEHKVEQRTRQLQESEARFRQMFERHDTTMLLIDPDNGAIMQANKAASQFYGYPAEKLCGMNIAQLNTQSPEELAAERAKARYEARNYFIFSHRLSNGDIRTVEVHSSPIGFGDKPLLFAIIHDITDRVKAEAEVHSLAFYDPLTLLPNRRLLLDRLDKALALATRKHRHGALMFLDLDHFKKLNDVHGHDIGDQLLIEVAHRLTASIRERDSAARLGGDEFVVMLEELSENEGEAARQTESVAEKIRANLAQPYLLKRIGGDGEVIEHHCTSSIGVTLFRDHKANVEEMLKWTDMAMYQAKNAGRNVIRFFDPAMQAAVEARVKLEEDLRIALHTQQFRLHYQVQVNNSNQPQGAEALLRWEHPQRGLVPPMQFIPMAEETGLILPIGQWVLDTTCAQLKAWQTTREFSGLQLAVNVSAKQFRQPDFVEQVETTVKRHGISPLLLKLELTESTVLENIDDAIAKIRTLKDFGIRFSLDDFGTGYSSLSYLKRLPLDQIKIDQSFVRDITTDHGDAVIVMTIVDLGMNFELEVIAEGVETEDQLKQLQRYGCGNFQGYLFNRPEAIDQFEARLKKGF